MTFIIMIQQLQKKDKNDLSYLSKSKKMRLNLDSKKNNSTMQKSKKDANLR